MKNFDMIMKAIPVGIEIMKRDALERSILLKLRWNSMETELTWSKFANVGKASVE